MRKLQALACSSFLILYSSCNSHETAARKSAIETSLKAFSEIEIPTGSRLNASPDGAAFLRRVEAAGLVRIEDVPQGYWDNFASTTFMGGTRPIKVMPTSSLEKIALNPRSKESVVPLSRAQIAQVLESTWNYYESEEIYLGANCVGNSTSFGRLSGPCALALESDYPTYRALADKGLLTITESRIDALPPGSLPSYANAQFVATIALTAAGERVAALDPSKQTATFTFGSYHVDVILKNETIQADSGSYRLVEGTHVFDVNPKLADLRATLGRTESERERRFRVVFKYDEQSSKWKVANASNGTSTAEDIGPRTGGYESDNVPPTVAELERRNQGNDRYSWRIHLGNLNVAEVLRDEEYKGPLAMPGETFRLVLATIGQTSPPGATLPAALTNLLPGRLRCILKYSDFKKEWTVIALDVGPRDSEQWNSTNVR